MLTRTVLVFVLAAGAVFACAACKREAPPKEPRSTPEPRPVVKTPLTDEQQEYVGRWVDAGSWIEIKQDGTLSYKLVDGDQVASADDAGVTITDDKMVVSYKGETEWPIERAPVPLDGAWTMKVNGRLFTRD